MKQFFVKEPGEKQAQKVDRDIRNGAFGRQVLSIEMVNPAGAGVGSDKLFCQLSHCWLHGRSIQQDGVKRKRS